MFPKHFSAGENTYGTHLQGGAAAALPVGGDEPRFGEHLCHTPVQRHSESAGQGYNSGREDTNSKAGWKFAACLLVLPHFCCRHVAVHENLLCMRQVVLSRCPHRWLEAAGDLPQVCTSAVSHKLTPTPLFPFSRSLFSPRIHPMSPTLAKSEVNPLFSNKPGGKEPYNGRLWKRCHQINATCYVVSELIPSSSFPPDSQCFPGGLWLMNKKEDGAKNLTWMQCFCWDSFTWEHSWPKRTSTKDFLGFRKDPVWSLYHVQAPVQLFQRLWKAEWRALVGTPSTVESSGGSSWGCSPDAGERREEQQLCGPEWDRKQKTRNPSLLWKGNVEVYREIEIRGKREGNIR